MVLEQILEWSQNRPPWQRDALRRLVVNGELSEDDITELTEVCKAAHNLAEAGAANPLTAEHIPAGGIGAAAVTLETLTHHHGINALAENQQLQFGEHLTVVYGDNAAGKSGYTRILKNACRSRGREEILGNIAQAANEDPVQSAAIRYKVGNESSQREWSIGDEDELLSLASVFDSHSAAVYLTKETDVAFRPLGLDLFDKLVQACKAVRERLEGEQSALPESPTAVLRAQIPMAPLPPNFWMPSRRTPIKQQWTESRNCLPRRKIASLPYACKSVT